MERWTRFYAGPIGIRIREGAKIFLSSKTSKPALELTQFRTHCEGISLPRVKRTGRDIHYSFPSCADVENEWSYNTTPLHAFSVVYGNSAAKSILHFKGFESATCSKTSQDTYRPFMLETTLLETAYTFVSSAYPHFQSVSPKPCVTFTC